MPGVVEHVVLSTGRALAGIADDPVELSPGDYISYPGDVPHLFQAVDGIAHAILISEHN
jgi:quercetin dioxygenase-like cupin family protein